VLVVFVAPLFAASSSKKQEFSPVKEKTSAETGYWITDKSGIRHNSKCRYYKTSKGHFCGKDEGKACKICGG
jgi:hypothetical protein